MMRSLTVAASKHVSGSLVDVQRLGPACHGLSADLWIVRQGEWTSAGVETEADGSAAKFAFEALARTGADVESTRWFEDGLGARIRRQAQQSHVADRQFT